MILDDQLAMFYIHFINMTMRCFYLKLPFCPSNISLRRIGQELHLVFELEQLNSVPWSVQVCGQHMLGRAEHDKVSYARVKGQ